MVIGEKLKQSRVEKGYSQKNVAEHLHISRQSISKWENGNSYPDLDNLIKLSKYYEISIDELLTENKVYKKKIKENEIEIEKNYKKLEYLNNKNEKDESLLLLIATFIGCLIAPLGFIMIPVIIIRNKKANTLRKLIYLACACCILVNLFVVYNIVGSFIDLSTTTIEYVE